MPFRYRYLISFVTFCKVDGVDLRDATHEEAVSVIRNANSPVKFVVRSLPELLNAQNSLNVTKSDSDGSVSWQVNMFFISSPPPPFNVSHIIVQSSIPQPFSNHGILREFAGFDSTPQQKCNRRHNKCRKQCDLRSYFNEIFLLVCIGNNAVVYLDVFINSKDE